MIKVIIFDYDGVIVDSFPSVHEVYLIICKKLGKRCPIDFEGFKKIYGYSYKELAKNLGLSEEETKQVDVIYSQEIIKKNPSVFGGIIEVINKLSKKYKLILVSANLRAEVMQKLKKFNLADKFDLIFASDKLGPLKKSEALVEVLKKTKSTPNEIIMIGDRTVDYDVGVKSGYKPSNIILVEYGWGYDKDKVPKQKTLVKKPFDLIKAIKRIEENP